MKGPTSRLVLLAAVACLVVQDPASAQLSNPESVEYDPVGDRYFISNTGSNSIKQRDQAGTITDLAAVTPAPYGLEIMGDVLYACSGGSIKGYDLDDGSLAFSRNLGGTFLNGITTDGEFLYVTDFGAGRIYKVDPVFIIGQLMGLGIYSRNLVFIVRNRKATKVQTEEPATGD